MITIIGLGPGDKDAITIGTLELLKKNYKIFFRTEKHPSMDFIKTLNVSFETYDYKYDSLDNFDVVYESIAMDLIEKHKQHGNIIYGVPGHPLVAEKSVSLLLELCKKEKIQTKVVSAVSFIDVMMECLNIDPVEGIKIIDAFDISNQVLDKRVGTIVTQVYNKFIASEVKLALLEYYKEDTELYFVRAAGIKNEESIRKIPLFQLDWQEDIDHLTSIYLPKDLSNTQDFYDLVEIMDTLRGEDGCPWDKEQTHESLKKYLVEECYEVLEAVDEENEEMLVEELGDVLLQVLFHARIGNEDGYFNINDVIKGICNKMIHRHPHIFKDVTVKDSAEVLKNWEAIKKEEKGFSTYTEMLKHIPKNLPALIRTEKIQKKASKVGFDWDSIDGAMAKVSEELQELKDVYKGKNRVKIMEEVGDLIFSTVNVARFLDIEPEFALNYTVDKFICRFEYIEKAAMEMGNTIEQMSFEQMNQLWEKAKKK